MHPLLWMTGLVHLDVCTPKAVNLGEFTKEMGKAWLHLGFLKIFHVGEEMGKTPLRHLCNFNDPVLFPRLTTLIHPFNWRKVENLPSISLQPESQLKRLDIGLAKGPEEETLDTPQLLEQLALFLTAACPTGLEVDKEEPLGVFNNVHWALTGRRLQEEAYLRQAALRGQVNPYLTHI